ncbi:response regulator transcription factor [Cohnella soli]|uniref:Helix-turn-helix domain-containing protein n=1 Tax=Cohnella soli TaxID=425005 RepID=A0ABW0HNV9_9BACL
MYKILIVDDEIFVRMGLKMSIDWHAHGLQLIGEASNGQQALELMKETTPDIVITDIKMPVMDGIKLIQEIAAAYPAVKCLVLSNYDEFELVKEAMKLGALDYFLKVTIESEKLIEAIKRVCERLDGERRAANEVREIVRAMNEHRTVIERKYYLELIQPEAKPGTFHAAVEALGLKLYDHSGAILMLLLRDYGKLLSERFQSNRRLLEFTILNVVEELINHHSSGKIIEHSDGVYAMIVSWKDQTDERQVSDLADRVRTALHDYLSIESNVVCGAAFQGYEQLRDGLVALDKAKLEAFYEDAGSVLRIGQTAFSDDGVSETYLNAKGQLALYVQLGDGPRIAACLDAFLDCVKMERIDPVLAKRHVLNLVGIVQDELSLRIEDKGNAPIDTAIAGKIDEAAGFAELKEIVLPFARQCEIRLESFRLQGPRDEIVQAIEYVKRHYAGKVSLEDIARRAAMNKSYFSRLFKQETGEAFQDFLIRTRMEQARELLLASDKKVADIAAEVGYNDIFYFTRAFKQYFKMSPGEYKKRNRPAPPK